MATLSQTASSVLLVSGNTLTKTAGGTITQGMPVYLDAATDTYKPAIGTSAAAAAATGLALSASSSGQPLVIALTGAVVNSGGTPVTGNVYMVSDSAAGTIEEVSDMGAGDFCTIVGIATSTTNILLAFASAGAAHG